MTSRGACATGQDVYLLQSSKGYDFVPAVGGAPGLGFGVGQWGGWIQGNPGANGIDRQTGGGGSGSGRNWMYNVSVGRGGYGTSFSGGVGSGSAQSDGGGGGDHHSPAAPDNGGPGGVCSGGASNSSGFSIITLSGNGNPANLASYGYRTWAGSIWSSVYGTGGLIIIYADKFDNLGFIQSHGGDMLTCSNGAGCVTTGGATGGGSINIFYQKLINKGSVTATGGRETPGGAVGLWGGRGGDGCVTLQECKHLFINVFSRKNSNFYKDTSCQEFFDYDRLF